MHTEQLTNLHPGWVVGGWLTAAAVTAGTYLAFVGLGFLPLEPNAVLAVALALAVGFFTGGFLVGLRWMDAPILHAVFITLLSVVIWFVGSVATPGDMPLEGATTTVLGLILLQLLASVAGGWIGRWVSLGRQGLPE